MALFDALINDVARRFGLGSNAAPLVAKASRSSGVARAGRRICRTSQIGRRLLAGDVLARLERRRASPPRAREVVGATAIGSIASRLGLDNRRDDDRARLRAAEVLGLLTPNGVIPTSLPAE